MKLEVGHEWLSDFARRVIDDGRSESTANAYTSDVRGYLAFCEGEGHLPFNVDTLDLFFMAMVEGGKKSNTFKRCLFGLRTWVGYLFENGVCDREILGRFVNYQLPAMADDVDHVRPLTNGDFQLVRRALSRPGRRYLRLAALFEVVANTAARASDVIGMVEGDFDEGGITMVDEGGGRRFSPFSPYANYLMQRYFEIEGLGDFAAPLFRSERGPGVLENTVQQRFRNISRATARSEGGDVVGPVTVRRGRTAVLADVLAASVSI